ncbi:CBS domain-containing protein [Pseudobacteriovorax antillogorgiicola]|uniref:CBS domain-containing protein n=1 Tax=Pseudobacteriovorax antillogorgiicola TaxID=1513793 RepID=A0A1Y6BPK9_9BACT|nr:CBS domain-containing protein [Pseudobacteriovorax antillogorgiicola]TCS55332.1 CBS domain protein [Pseudobacteriovorax antillogorgiicola]SMF14055.1 CBS domain-containing protein [Pseudobacteriovorax antillogorgiicola]
MLVKDCIDFSKKKSLVSVESDENIQFVYELMKKEGIHHAAVLRNGDLVGLVDYDAILNAVMLSPQHFNSLQAQDIMKTGLHAVDGESTLDNLVLAFNQKTVRALPYYEEGRLVSLVTQTDLLQILSALLKRDQSILDEAEAKGELFMANPVVQRVMNALSGLGI